MLTQVALLGLLILALLAALSWRQCAKGVLLLVVIEGAIRKWALPHASLTVFFAKDVLLLGCYIKFLLRGGKFSSAGLGPLFKLWLYGSTAICLLQIANPRLGSPVYGLFGVRNYLLYIPLMFLVPLLFDSVQEVKNFMFRYALIALPVSLVGILQFYSPAEATINRYAWGPDSPDFAMLEGNLVRITGTFSYVASYAIYLFLIGGMTFALFSLERGRRRLILLANLVLVVANMSMNGSRGTFIAFGIFVILYLVISLKRQGPGFLLQVCAGTLIAAALLMAGFESSIEPMRERFEKNTDLTGRIAGIFRDPNNNFNYSGIFGYGSGSAYQALPQIQRLFGLPEPDPIPVYFEGEPGRVMLELGPIGFLMWYALRLSLLAALWKSILRVRNRTLFQLGLAALLILTCLLPGQMVFQTTFMVYHWFLAGFAFLLPRLDQRAAAASAAAASG